MAAFPGAIATLTNPTGTDRTNLVDHAAQHTSANDEIEAIETALGVNLANVAAQTAWTDYSATSTITGFTGALSTKKIYYTKIGSLVLYAFNLAGTSDATSITFTLPYTAAAGFTPYIQACLVVDDGVDQTLPGLLYKASGTATVEILKTFASGSFTTSGTKQAQGQGWYIAA